MISDTLTIVTERHMELVDITTDIAQKIANTDIESGICYLYNPHTTAGLTINEGADPAVQEDIISGMKQMVPKNYPFKHMEGNSPSHIMASLMGSSLTIFIEGKRPLLGTWQKIFFCEFDGPRTRNLLWRILKN